MFVGLLPVCVRQTPDTYLQYQGRIYHKIYDSNILSYNMKEQSLAQMV
jgi:hypothetical protein